MTISMTKIRPVLKAISKLPILNGIFRAIWSNSYTTRRGRFFKINLVCGESWWFVRWKCRVIKVRLTSAKRKRILIELLGIKNDPLQESASVTITVPSRKLGNRDSQLTAQLSSFVTMTDHPERFEILIKIDDDDDLSYFNKLKKEYHEIDLRFVVSPRGLGYAHMTHFHSLALEQASDTSKAWLCTWDDWSFIRKGWDQDVYRLIDTVPFFIAGQQPFETVISLMELPTQPEPVYGYDCEINPIISFNIIRALKAAAEGLDNWLPLGDLYTVDGFFGSVVDLFYRRCGFKVYQQIDNYMFALPRVITWTNNPERINLYYREHKRFFEESVVEVRARVVETIYEKLSA